MFKRRVFMLGGVFALVTALLTMPVGSASAAPQYSNGFEINITDWDAFGGALDATRVASGTNGITSASGSWHAENSATGSASRWGGYNFGAGNAVPTAFHEYSTSLDIYLNVAGGWANDTRFDFDSAINNASGTFNRDFIFNAGFYNDTDGSPGSGTSRFVISASNNSQPGSAFAKNPGRAPIAISTSGWYTFEHRFYDSAGVLAVEMSIYDASSVLVNSWTLSDASDLISVIGGNRYGWFDYNQFSTLAFDNAIRFEPEPQCTTVCYVDDAAGNDANGGASAADAKKTIQAAVNQVTAGGDVIVAAGTYGELVNVNKTVTISGAQAGVDARTRVGAESIVQGNAGTTSFYVTVDDVTIDGFTVQGQTNANQSGAGIVLGAGTSHASILNNIVTQNMVGLFLANDNVSGQTVIRHNLFRSNNNLGPASSHGIYTDQYVGGGTVENVLIDANLFEDHDEQAIGFSSTSAAAPATDITITDNTFDGNGRGLYAFNLTNSTITGNTFENATWGATADIRIFEGVDGLTIDHNVLMNGAGSAYRASNVGTGAADPTDIHLNRNSITGYTGPPSTVQNDAIPLLDAECNWWGGVTGAGVPNSTAGSNVDATPWLTTSNLNGPCFGGTWTFQGFFSPVDNPPTLNMAKAGQTIPIKWRILDEDSVPINDPSSFVSLTSFQFNCDSLAYEDTDLIETYSGNSGLQSKGDGNWQFNWATPTSYTGKCRTLVLTLADGSVHTANFKFK